MRIKKKQSNDWVIVVSMVVQLLGLVLFAYGYFSLDDQVLTENQVSDLKLSLPHETQEQLSAIQIKCSSELSKEAFSKMVFIVIDALRADFIPSLVSGKRIQNNQFSMPFLEELINSNQAIGIISEAQTPTVTMPRIKALMSGTFPNFMDLVYNLNAKEFGDDNLIEQATLKSKRIVFYGDDTWLQMFPENKFLRSNGTSSFFATDYVQVDTNVTENAIPELERLNEWDFLILHYLGVDHIGHSHGGAFSRLMKTKLIEMDQVIHRIYDSVKETGESYLLVVTGDHGMTDAGNHGGSTTEETNSALVLVNISPKRQAVRFPKLSIKQLDVAATLSSLLGLPIPNKSRGKIIYPVLKSFGVSETKILCNLNENSLQMQKMVTASVKSEIQLFINAVHSHFLFLNGKSLKNSFASASKDYLEYISRIQESLTVGKSHKSVFSILTLGILLSISAMAQLIQVESERPVESILQLFMLRDPMNAIHVGLTVLSVLLLGSTSFIEMESYYWHLLSSSLMVLNLFINFQKYQQSQLSQRRVKILSNGCDSSQCNGYAYHETKQFYAIRFLCLLAILVILRLTSCWNILNEPDISGYLSDQQHRHFLSSLVIITMASVTFLYPTIKIGKLHVLLLSGFSWIYMFRCDLGSLTGFNTRFLVEIGVYFSTSATTKARLVYLHLFGIPVELAMRRLKLDTNWLLMDDFIPNYLEENQKRIRANRVSALRIFCTSWILLSALLLKVQNIPLLGLNVLLEKLVHKCIQGSLRSNRQITFIVTYLAFATSAFYSQGNSNSISTIDVASGYIGLESYNLFLVGSLVASSTYALYIFWILMLFIRIDESRLTWTPYLKWLNLMSCINFVLIVRVLTATFYSIVAFVLQNHLFIWSVICPKFMYEACLTILTCLLMVIVTVAHKIDT